MKEKEREKEIQLSSAILLRVCLGCYASLGPTLCRGRSVGTQSINRHCLQFTTYGLYINIIRMYSLKIAILIRLKHR